MEASALQAPIGLGRISLNATLLRLRSDEQLVALFRAGNEEAYRVIHDRYRQRLFAYVRQMLAGSGADSEDALQDVFLRAYASLRNDDRPIALRAWLYRVAHNRCIDQLRRPVPANADVFDVSRSPAPDPLAEAERREDLRRLVADVRRLPEQQRSALLMRELEGLSYAELAAAHGASVPAIKSLLVRARIGLVQAAEARDTTCHDIRADLALAHGRGVRANGRARRHLRDCPGCREYRSGLRSVQRSFAALAPAGAGSGLLAKLGAGGGGGGAAASGGAAGGSGVIGGTMAVTAGKVCAVVCSVAVTAGGAVEVQHEISGGGPVRSRPASAARGGSSSAGLEARAPDAVLVPARQTPELVRRAATKEPAVNASDPTAAATTPPPGATDPNATGPSGASRAGADPTSAPTGGTQAPTDLPADNPTGTADPKATGADGPTAPVTGLAGSGSADPGAGSATGSGTGG